MNNTLSNLPTKQAAPDSADKSRVYLNNFGQSGEEYSGADVDATVGFLSKRGFGLEAATVTSMVLLRQAKQDNISVFKLLDTLDTLRTLELSALVSEILNQNRSQTSRLGFKVPVSANQQKIRNIKA
jgi:hypothetical protein